MYDKVDSKLNAPEREVETLKLWRERDIFKKTMSKKANKHFNFYEGPPGANGLPHIGHLFSRTIKDVFTRFKSMQGYKVIRKAGWDTHGLPVELKAEKDLGLTNKKQIEEFGVEKFINKCKEVATTYVKEWKTASERMGYWLDFDNAYWTCKDDYIESVWWSLKQIFDKGLIYQGNKIVQFCPRCETALSSHEVAQGYKTVKTNTLFVKFKAKTEKDTYFVAWTTTPWTLPSNVALAVNAKEDYVKVEHEGEFFIVAKALAQAVLPEGKVVKAYKGKQLEGVEYEPLFDYVKGADKKAWYVTNADFVTLTDGTGIVHIAPAFGEDDAQVGKAYNLPHVQLVNAQGRFFDATPDLAGLSTKEANAVITKGLKARGLVLSQKELEHEYPHCWRCDTPLLNYGRAGWFIKMSEFRDKLLANNNTVDWHPENVREGRMGNFLGNAVDWNLSRERYWATPLPIWVCNCGHKHAVGSRKELGELVGKPVDCELHKPWVDKITFKCTECGGVMTRTPEVIDVWYDSGAMPFAQWHYPFENEAQFKAQFPADFIAEGQDQTRGWFYTLQAINTVLFNKTPYKNVIINGMILDDRGLKMSKSVGNVISPTQIMDTYGADAMRWSFATGGAPWLSRNYSMNIVSDVIRKMISTLQNTYAFFVLYADIDNFNGLSVKLSECPLSLMDKWVLSRFNSLVALVTSSLEEYKLNEPAREIQDFVDELSNWYVRRSRERFWVDGESEDKTAAFATLYFVLVNLAKLLAPFMPFITEDIYQNLVYNLDNKQPESVHLAEFPKSDKSRIDAKLEAQMKTVVDIVVLARSARNTANINTRQPLHKLMLHSEAPIKLTKEMSEIIKEEINVKELEVISKPEQYINYELKPQLKTLGPKYGSRLGEIRKFLEMQNILFSTEEFIADLKAGKEILLDGTDIVLTEADLLLYPHVRDGFAAETNFGLTVVLDTSDDPNLTLEGHAREITSRIQNMRKAAGLEVVDRIDIRYIADAPLSYVFEDTASLKRIKSVTLADDVAPGMGGNSTKADFSSWNICFVDSVDSSKGDQGWFKQELDIMEGIKCEVAIKKVS